MCGAAGSSFPGLSENDFESVQGPLLIDLGMEDFQI